MDQESAVLVSYLNLEFKNKLQNYQSLVKITGKYKIFIYIINNIIMKSETIHW